MTLEGSRDKMLSVLMTLANLAWQAWKSDFNAILDHHAPITHMRVRQSSVPWLTFDIKKMMKGRDYHKNMLLNTARTTTGYFINLPEIR